MAIALPMYLAALTDSEIKTCRANMQTISNAETAYKTSNVSHTYTTDLTNLSNNVGNLTTLCPHGGSYSVVISAGSSTANNGTSVPMGGLVVHCSAAGHGVFAPGIDSQ